MNKIVWFFLVALSCHVSASVQTEIQHLLNFIAVSECHYERNGTMYDARAALDHIQKKHDYFSDKIKTPEDFIQYAATKSNFSGKYYHIHCDGNAVMRSQDWLLRELSGFRATKQ